MHDKVVVITGASSGIGLACAKKFLAEGANVVMAARDNEKLLQQTKSFVPFKSKVITISCDVGNDASCKLMIEQTVKEFGKIDVLINNAGISMRALFNSLDLNVIKSVMQTNFWGTVYCTKYALPYLLKTKGSVVGISSVAGKKGLPGRTGYSASKFAMEGFLESLRTENLKTGLHVLVACPGFTASNIRNAALNADGKAQGESPRDEKNMMSADEVADAIYHAVVKRKRDLLLTANGKLTVWLNKFFPRMMDGVVFNHISKEEGSPF